MAYLNQWCSIEREHNFALQGAIEDLQASTLRLPVTGFATVNYIFLKACFYMNLYTTSVEIKKNTIYFNDLQANIQSVKSAVYSAIQVMQAIGSSIQSTLSRVRFISFQIF